MTDIVGVEGEPPTNTNTKQIRTINHSHATPISSVVIPSTSPNQAFIPWSESIDRLRNDNPLHLDEESEPDDPQNYIVEEDTSLERYLSYKGLDDRRVRLCWENNNVLIYELKPSAVHESIGGWINGRFERQLADGLVRDNGGAGLSIGNPINRVYEPDRAIVPLGRPIPVAPPTPQSNASGFPFPTLIIEVGVTQTLASLHHKARHYLDNSTDIQMVLCVKLFPRYQNNNFNAAQPVQGNNTQTTYCVIALLYRRAFSQIFPEFVISFGTRPLVSTRTISLIRNWGVPNASITGYRGGANPIHAFVNAAGQATHLLQIPTQDLFHGVPGGVPGGVPANIVLDLFLLRNHIIQPLPSFTA